MQKLDRILKDDLMNHPAVRAWRKLGLNRIKPTAIINLKKRRRRKRGKSAVYRLLGVGPAGTCVVAKRCKRDIAVTEKKIYEEILSNLPISSLRCYGYIEDYEQEYYWLFLEDAGEIKYTSKNEFHRIAATKWLATLHTTATNFTGNIALKDRGPKYYLNHLRSARNKFYIISPVLHLIQKILLFWRQFLFIAKFLSHIGI